MILIKSKLNRLPTGSKRRARRRYQQCPLGTQSSKISRPTLGQRRGKTKVYSVYKAYQLTNRIVSRFRYTFKQVWIRDVLLMGINSDEMEVTLVRDALNTEYLDELIVMLETIIEKNIKWQVFSSDSEIVLETPLLVWQKQNEE